jgi:hypothetical protein
MTSIARLVDLARLPRGAGEVFVARETELAALDAAWETGGVVAIVAPGGIGKTALVDRWLGGLRAEAWPDAEAVYAWSFHSQGTDGPASEDGFLPRS